MARLTNCTVIVMTVVSLQSQCLYFLAGSLEKYSTEILSLLPVARRRQLLLHLPVIDVCRLERDATFMKGVNMESLWGEVLQNKFSYRTDNDLREALRKHSTAKDTFLSEVSRVLLVIGERYSGRYTSPIIRDGGTKEDVIAFLLYGIRLVNDTVSLHSLSMSTLLGFTWGIPLRYAKERAGVDTLAIVKTFLDTFEWYPTSFDLTEYDILDDAFEFGNNRIFQSFVSHVEAIHVENNGYTNYIFAEFLKPLWHAVASSKHKSFTSVSFSASVMGLGNFISNMVDILYTEADDYISGAEPEEEDVESDSEFDYSHFYKYTGLKKMKICGNDGGTHPHDFSLIIEDLVTFICKQDGLEELIIEGLQNIVESEDEERYYESDSSYEGFDGFFNYLPHFITKPSFKFLSVISCHVPCNTVESMVNLFLSSPTTHAQSLNLGHCLIVDKSLETLPNHELIKSVPLQCVSGEYKSLSLPVFSPLCPPQWLFEYQNLWLKRLELNYYPGSQNVSTEAVSELSNCFHNSIDTFCFNFHGIGYNMTEKHVHIIQKIAQLPSLAELGFVNCYCQSGEEYGLLPILQQVFSQPLQLLSLRRLGLQAFSGLNIITAPKLGSAPPEYSEFRSFFNVLFSMPKEQLAEFTLDLSENRFYCHHEQDIVKAWKANAHGQKLKKISYISRGRYNDSTGSGYDSFRDLAVDVDI